MFILTTLYVTSLLVIFATASGAVWLCYRLFSDRAAHDRELIASSQTERAQLLDRLFMARGAPPMAVNLTEEYAARKESVEDAGDRKTRQRPQVLGPLSQAQQEAFKLKEKELGATG